MRAAFSLKLERWTTPSLRGSTTDRKETGQAEQNHIGKSVTYPSTNDMLRVFACSHFKPTELTETQNPQEMMDRYKGLAGPAFDRMFDDRRHNEVQQELDYIIFFGRIDNGAEIIVSKPTWGEVKVRICHDNLKEIIASIQSFLDDVQSIERYYLQIDGDNLEFSPRPPPNKSMFRRAQVRLFQEHRVHIRVHEDRHTNAILEGTTKNYVVDPVH